MSRKRIVIIGVLLGIVVIGGIGAVGLWQYHEQPQFCATCHIMDPYLESWQGSDYGAAGHAEQGVACLDCHEPTIQQQMDELVVYVQGDFTIPLEEREFGVEFCFNCHQANEHTDYEEVIQRTEGLEINPHDSHLGAMKCGSCHKMHGPSEDYCAQCHGPVAAGPGWTRQLSPKAPAPPAVPIAPTAKAVATPTGPLSTPLATTTMVMEPIDWDPDIDCAACHDMLPYSESLQDSTLLAYARAEEGLECLDCHNHQEELQRVHEEAIPGTPIKARWFEMDFCFDCHLPNEHTSYQQVIERTNDYIIDDQEINPHDPHAGLGEPQVEC